MPNWVKDHFEKEGKMPKIPHYLNDGFQNHRGEVTPDMQILTPSGQLWNSLSPSQQKQWRELVEYLGKDPEDYLAHMRMMFPQDPPMRKR